jgi:hypothetical protein
MLGQNLVPVLDGLHQFGEQLQSSRLRDVTAAG